MDQTFWGVVSAAVGRLGKWGVNLRYPFPLASCIWFTTRRPFKTVEVKNYMIECVLRYDPLEIIKTEKIISEL